MKNILILMIAIIVMASCETREERLKRLHPEQYAKKHAVQEANKTPDNMLGAMLEDGRYIIISSTDNDVFVSKGDTMIIKRTWDLYDKIPKGRDRIYYTVYGKYIGSIPKTKVTYDSSAIYEYYKGIIL